MKRRAALAGDLFLTTIAGFFIVAYGTQVGFFGGGDNDDEGQADAAPGMYLKVKALTTSDQGPTAPDESWVAVSVKEATP